MSRIATFPLHAFLLLGLASAARAEDGFEKHVLPVLENYCLDCHDGAFGTPKGDFDIEPFFTAESAKADPGSFERIRNVLHYREMPPEEKDRPSAEQRDAVIAWINQEVLRQKLYHGERDPGPPMARRLTRLEYNNTVRDLLGMEKDVYLFSERLIARRDYFDPSKDALPDELKIHIPEYGSKMPALLRIANLPGDSRAAHGFFNQGDKLDISPLLMERYLEVATAIVEHRDFRNEAWRAADLLGAAPVRRATGGSNGGGGLEVEVKRAFAPVENLEVDAPDSSDQGWLFRDHMASAFDEGSGGVFQGAEKAANVRSGRSIRVSYGLGGRQTLIITPSADLWFVDFGTAHETSPPTNIANRQKGQKQFRLGFALDGAPAGDGILSLGVAVLSRDRVEGRVTLTAHFAGGGSASLTDEISEGGGKDNTFFAWQAPPGDAIVELTVDGSEFGGDFVLLDDLGFITGRSEILAERVESGGEAESGTEPAVQEGLRGQFAGFLGRAFRSKVTEEEVATYWGFFEANVEQGLSQDDAMRETLRAVLSSPRFLLVSESAGTGESPVRKLSGMELANRLSYFLWSTMPDDELLELGRSGELTDPAVLEAQVKRMLRDPKVKELSESFAYQWLRLNQLLGAQPDERRYKRFYVGSKGTMAGAFLQEPLLLFETVLIENRPVMDLVDPDFTWLNAELIDFYNLEEHFEDHLKAAKTVDKNGRERTDNGLWFRCELPDRTRGGILCMGSTLTLTSLPLRTSPVYRGTWVTEVVFNRPPPPPPADVEPLGDDDRDIQEAGLTLREKLKMHAKDPACAGCHSRLDPLGFPLENYDGIGRWRDSYGKFPVDSAGVLMREHPYQDIVDFKDAIRERETDFVHGFIRHLLTYALGHKLGPKDDWAVEEIYAEVSDRDYRLQDVVLAIVESYPFQHARDLNFGGAE